MHTLSIWLCKTSRTASGSLMLTSLWEMRTIYLAIHVSNRSGRADRKPRRTPFLVRIDRGPLGMLGEDLMQLPEQRERSLERAGNIADG